MNKKTSILMILDGWGIGRDYEGNAVLKADTPNFDRLIKKYPNTQIRTSGLDVGLPEGQMGNSEVGHMNIGSGRIVYQEFTRITKSIEDGSIENNEKINKAFDNVKKNKSKLHYFGLLSDGGVHSFNGHLYSLVKTAQKKGVEKVCIHCFTDGRDVSPTSGAGFIKELQEKIDEIGVGKIATISGRYYSMDRDNRYERTKQAYDAMTKGIGVKNSDPVDAVRKSYENDVTDEFIKPVVVSEDCLVEDNDSVIFYNFRPDRARQITRAFVDDDFDKFEREKLNLTYVTLTQYDKTIKNVEVAFEPQVLENTFGEYLGKLGKKQLRIAETEKYAHVTFFFNGGVETPYEGEERILVPSPKVATYDMQPEMSAYKVKDKLIAELNKDYLDFVIINFANPDMVGHTGDIDAAVKAVEAVDECLGEIADYVEKHKFNMVVTADHGNAEEMLDDGQVMTAHSNNKVPCILISDKNYELREGRLADIAPTILELMDLDKPKEMTGESLLNKGGN